MSDSIHLAQPTHHYAPPFQQHAGELLTRSHRHRRRRSGPEVNRRQVVAHSKGRSPTVIVVPLPKLSVIVPT